MVWLCWSLRLYKTTRWKGTRCPIRIWISYLHFPFEHFICLIFTIYLLSCFFSPDFVLIILGPPLFSSWLLLSSQSSLWLYSFSAHCSNFYRLNYLNLGRSWLLAYEKAAARLIVKGKVGHTPPVSDTRAHFLLLGSQIGACGSGSCEMMTVYWSHDGRAKTCSGQSFEERGRKHLSTAEDSERDQSKSYPFNPTVSDTDLWWGFWSLWAHLSFLPATAWTRGDLHWKFYPLANLQFLMCATFPPPPPPPPNPKERFRGAFAP